MLEKLTIKFDNPDQILNMGGPWVGNLYINDKLVDEDIIIDNYILDKNCEKIYFIKYKKVSKWMDNNKFFLRYWELSSKKLFEYELSFNFIFLVDIKNENEIIYYKSFHGKNDQQRHIINLNSILIREVL